MAWAWVRIPSSIAALQNLYFRTLTDKRFQVNIWFGKEAGIPLVDVGFFIIESGDKDFGRRQFHGQYTIFKVKIFRLEFFHVDPCNHRAMTDKQHLVTK